MNADEPGPPEERYAELFAACDEALGAGQAAEPLSNDVPALVRARLERDLACAHLLRQVLGSSSATGPTIAPAPPGTGTLTAPPLPTGGAGTVIRVYRLLEKIGQGGMGAVYRAMHQELGKVVAVKLIGTDRVGNAGAVARFKREIRAVGKLEHAHLVRALDAGEEKGTHYLVMEYVPGQDLGRLADRLGPLGVADACALVRQAALGLQYAHEHGLVHRDIKPSNLILADAGASAVGVKVVDFGLALLADRGGDAALTGHGQLMGTLDYMAPEQGGDSHRVDHRADLYGLGATLYKLLCGEVPLPAPAAATPLRKVMALALGEVVPLRQRRPEVPEPLAAFVHRLLAKAPADRPASAAEVAAALEPFCRAADLPALLQRAVAPAPQGPTVPARPEASETLAPARTPADRTDRRRRWLLAVLGAAALVLAGTLTFHIVTDRGELIIRSSDPDVEITVKRNGKPIQDLTLSRGENVLTVRSGEVEVVLKGARADTYEIKNQPVVLSRGDRPVIEIIRRPGRGPGAPGDSGDADRVAAEWVLSVGGWVGVGVERKLARAPGDLPSTPFRLVQVFLPGSRGFRDADLRHLRGLPELVFLDVTSTPISDAGLGQLTQTTSLGGLRADFTPVTDKGAAHLKELKNLQYLSLGGTAVTDEALRSLKELPRLSDLGLSYTGVSDGGLQHLADQFSLTRLKLTRTRVTDAGLRHLHRLTRLVELEVRETRVTAAGVAELQKALPKCKVLRDGMATKP